MSFRDNLQHLRATRNMTQEQLAMLVGVSRQSVTKWEAERAYPEMDKLLQICQIFDCTLDELVTGDLTNRQAVQSLSMPAESTVDSIGYEDHLRSFAKKISLGVTCIIGFMGLGFFFGALIGLANMTKTFGSADDITDIIILAFILGGIALGLAFIIPASATHREFRRQHPYLIDFLSSEDRIRNTRKRGKGIALGIGFIFLGVIFIASSDLGSPNEDRESLLAGIMLICMAIGVGLIVFSGIMWKLNNINDYNMNALCALEKKEFDSLLEDQPKQEQKQIADKRKLHHLKKTLRWSIMIIATIIGLPLLVVANSSLFWIPWLIGGLFYGLAFAILKEMNMREMPFLSKMLGKKE